jgi:penicillin-binding protein 1C
MHPDCVTSEEIDAMDLIYPKHSARVYIPYEMDGSRGQLVLEAAHRRSDIRIYWHLDDQYLGMTQHIHQLGISPAKGKHRIVLVDELGNILERKIEILDKKE